MNRKLLFVVVVLAAVFVLGEGGRRRRNRRNCPRTDSESNGDHWCCDVKTKNVTEWNLLWLPCDEVDALRVENGEQHPPQEEIDWCGNSRKRRSGHHGWEEFCSLWISFNVTIAYNDWKCCDGWSMDFYGYCSIADDSTSMFCENGGSVMDESYCVCQAGFIGTHCEIPVCTPACQNNGHCSSRDGRPVCVCPENFAGNHCETPVCEKPCLNGGLCVADACETRCRCRAGYAGRYCEIVIKEGDCPIPHSFGSCHDSCSTDSECLGTHKCCYNGCGNECMKPINSSRCVYNNRTYSVGEQMARDDCTTCLCLGEGMTHDPSGFDCFTIMCTMAFCPPGTTLKDVPGNCCGQCEAFECPNGCGHGQCEMQNGSPKCRCPPNFRGDSCEIPVCDSPCQNGGTCKAKEMYTYCACTPAYTGPSCEIKLRDKEGVCPTLELGQVGLCVESCTHDSDCDGHQKCCSNGCGHVCMDPQHVCQIGDVTYRKGETLDKSPCETCKCMGQGYGTDPTGFTCHKMMCAQVRCGPGFVMKSSPDKCCPYCEEQKPPAPEFKQCPAKLTIEVNSYDKLVDLTKAVLPKLSAVDGNGQSLEISLNHRQLEHCVCPQSQRNIHNIVATTKPDKYGRTAACVMAVRVKDVHPPKFISCPSNIDAFTTEAVTWDMPKHVDNVGINSLDFLGSRRNNTRFPVGSFLLGYIARDYEGNVAVCQFKVSVWEEDSDDVSMPRQLKKIQEDSVESNKMFIGVGAALGALITVAVVVALYICCRKSAAARAANHHRPSGSNNDGFDNGIYAIYGNPPPEYDYPGKGKLPEYSNSEPPDYESVDPYPEKSQGVENPTYVSTIDVKLDFDNKVNESLSE